MKHFQAIGPQPEADQTVRLQIDTAAGCPSIRIGFTDQRLTAHGGMVVWSHFLHQKRFRHELTQVLPHDPTSPNAYDPTDVALGYVGDSVFNSVSDIFFAACGFVFATTITRSACQPLVMKVLLPLRT